MASEQFQQWPVEVVLAEEPCFVWGALCGMLLTYTVQLGCYYCTLCIVPSVRCIACYLLLVWMVGAGVGVGIGDGVCFGIGDGLGVVNTKSVFMLACVMGVCVFWWGGVEKEPLLRQQVAQVAEWPCGNL